MCRGLSFTGIERNFYILFVVYVEFCPLCCTKTARRGGERCEVGWRSKQPSPGPLKANYLSLITILIPQSISYSTLNRLFSAVLLINKKADT